jgi:hypothetical protein
VSPSPPKTHTHTHRSVAIDVVKDMTKQRFKAYVQQAQKERDRRSAAQVLKKLVQVRHSRPAGLTHPGLGSKGRVFKG